MSKRSKFGDSADDQDDIRAALKLPARGSLQNRQVSTAFNRIKQLLRSSSSGGTRRTGLSKRTRGQAVAGSLGGKLAGPNGTTIAAKPKPLQRVAVRWTYSKNQGNGQWGAHGRYIERESAQDKDLNQERDKLELDQQAGQAPAPSLHDDKEPNHERDQRHPNAGIAERYADLDAARSAGRLHSTALLQPKLAAFGKAPPAKSLDNLRSLSRVGLVHNGGNGGVLLQGHAPQVVDGRGTKGAELVRRPGAGRNGKAGPADESGRVKRAAVGFGSEGPAVHISETLDRWQQAGDDRMFKLIVSPEFGDRMNLRKHVSDLMLQMEKDLGTKLEWVAVDHYNTDNPHAHLAIRGVDDRGRALEVSPEYISQGSRIRAQELATRELGYRTERDVAEAMERQVTQQRFTDIDRTLLKMGNEQGALGVDMALLKAAASSQSREIDYSGGPPESERARAARLAQIERLAYLEQHGLAKRTGDMKWFVSPELATRKPDAEKLIRFDANRPTSEAAREARLMQIRRLAQLTSMGLAEKTGSLTWRLNPMMETALRQMQITQDRLKTRFAHREMISDPSAPLVVAELKNVGDRVAGKLVGTGLNEATNRSYLLVEGFDGKVHYVNQTAKVQQLRGEGALRAGEYVSLELVERKDAAGRVTGTMQKVERFGRELTPELLDAELLKGGKVVEPAALKKSVAGAFRDAAAARLAKLQAAGAVEIEGGKVRTGSREAHDLVQYEDAGIRSVPFDGKGPVLATVLAKGRATVAIAPSYGRKLTLTALQLEGMGLAHKFVAKDSVLFIGVDAKGNQKATAMRLEQAPAMVNDRRINKLDAMVQQLQPIQVPAGHPLHAALRDRAAAWEARGVDLHSPDFALKANIWRKGVELQEAAQQKGVQKVLEELALQKGKPVRDLNCEAGRQVTGRVVLVQVEGDHTAVVVDSGSHLTRLRQPAPAETSISTGGQVRAGQLVQARAQEIVDDSSKRRMMTWRFADMEREQARKKGREDRAF
jgi:type IV secretory pathway VirD2 relaxase